MTLTQERLKELLHYDPETGVFTHHPGSRRAGVVVGRVHSLGYWRVGIGTISNGGATYFAHRLVWLYVHGTWPEGQIDHVNGNRLDNRIANLRDATHSVNQQNMKRAQVNNKTGLLGVSAVKGGTRFLAQIRVGRKNTYIGLFRDPKVAHEAYLKAKRALHEGNTL